MQEGTMTKARVHTWADGFGRWYAAVPGDRADPRRTAREAIRRELTAREGDLGAYQVRVEEAPDEWLSTERALRPVFREAWDHETGHFGKDPEPDPGCKHCGSEVSH